MPERFILKVTHTALFYCKCNKKLCFFCTSLEWLWRETGIQRVGMLPKNKSIPCGNPWGLFQLRNTENNFYSYSGMWQGECWDSLDYLTTAMWSSRHVILQSVFFKKKKVISEQCNNSLDRNQNNLQYLFYFPSATSYVTATRSEKHQNVHSSLPHTTEISENIYFVQRNPGVETIEINTWS